MIDIITQRIKSMFSSLRPSDILPEVSTDSSLTQNIIQSISTKPVLKAKTHIPVAIKTEAINLSLDNDQQFPRSGFIKEAFSDN